MLEVLLFVFKYKIKGDPCNLSRRGQEFFKLSLKGQMKVLDIYFANLTYGENVSGYFDSKDSFYYEDNREKSFFDSDYFCWKLVLFDARNLYLIDKFKISLEKKKDLIKKGIGILLDNKFEGSIEDFLVYPNNLPVGLSSSIDFMRFMVRGDKYNIKYITYSDGDSFEQRELVREVIGSLRGEFDIEKFYLNDKVLPKFLLGNVDFIVYMLENDWHYIEKLDDSFVLGFVDRDLSRIVGAIMKSFGKSDRVLDLVDNSEFGIYLSRNVCFVNYIIGLDVDNVRYVDWHNIVSGDVKGIVDGLALKLVRDKNYSFDYSKYSFKNIFRQNYMFMAYMISRDKHSIRDVLVVNPLEVSKIVDIYLNKYRKDSFVREDFLDEGGFVRDIYLHNKYMLSFLIKKDNRIFECIDFSVLSDSKDVIEVIIKQMGNKSFVFCNECFLRNGKYPLVLSNSYRFMREVIDRNFNNLAYMDITGIDNKNLKRVINYAFRMVYYIRGSIKNLNFDIDGYFRDSDIFYNDYFQECLKCL